MTRRRHSIRVRSGPADATNKDPRPRLIPRLLGIGAAIFAVAGTAVAGAAATGMTAVTAGRLTAPTLLAAKDIKRPDDGSFMRVVGNESSSIALEIASRRYVRPEGGPDVTLVGVVHIGDRKYYRKLQEQLARHDVVLYESVKPAGTGGAGGATPEINVETTREAMRFVARVIEQYRIEMGEYPEDLDAAREFLRQDDARLAAFFDIARRDAWQRSLVYQLEDGQYRLSSYGGDLRPGGTENDADLVFDEPITPQALSLGGEDGIQVQLAQALALAFQLEAVDYGRPNWRCSDMSIDQVQRAMAAHGADFALVEGSLAGTSFPAKVARFFLGLVRMADVFTSGAVSDMIKVVLIETLGDEKSVQQTLRQFDEGFARVIIDERNKVVLDDLDAIIRDEPEIESVGVFYGAGHMRDMQERLVAKGYEPATVRWHRAIEVDLANSPMSKAEIRQMRMMVRRTMQQMQRR